MPLADLLCSARLYQRDEVLSHLSPVPKAPGVYAWYFSEVPSVTPVSGCVQREGHTLLYVGISPSAPLSNGKPSSRQFLWHRIRYHYCGNAEGSTLRLTLGCLLASKLGIELRCLGSGNRMIFGPRGEAKLSEWMGENASVAFHVCERPWEAEAELISSVCLPLNLDQNRRHQFHSTLSALRPTAKQRARQLQVLGGSEAKTGS